MFKVKITKSGKVFEKTAFKKIIKDAVAETAPYAKGVIQSFTPVRTGTLQRAWQVIPTNVAIDMENDTPYCIYVEGRVHMVEKTAPLVQDRLVQNIKKRIYKLNG